MEDIEYTNQILFIFSSTYKWLNGVVNKSLRYVLRCLVTDNMTQWLILPTTEFSYNSSINRTTSHSPFEFLTGILPRKPIDFVHLPPKASPSVDANEFANHIRNIHDDVWSTISISNESYKSQADLRRHFAKFNEGDMAVICIRS